MTASRVRTASLLVLAAALAGPAAAQEPLRLWPPPSGRTDPGRGDIGRPESGRPDPGRPASGPTDTRRYDPGQFDSRRFETTPVSPFVLPDDPLADRPLPAPPARRSTAVEVEPLAPPAPDAVGLLDPKSGLGASLWAQSSRAEVAALLRKLPPRIDSAVLHDLARRLLLTRANLPPAEAGGPPILALRVAGLATIGAVEDAGGLLRAAPSGAEGRDRDETLLRLELELALLNFDLPAACKAAQAGIASHTDAAWQKAVAFCQAQAGERDRAGLTVGLLREANHQDPAFFALLDDILDLAEADPGLIREASPLLLAMLRAAGKPVPPGLLADAKPALLRTIALSPDVDSDSRVEAAERALAANALDPKVLAELYQRVQPGPGEAGALEPSASTSAPWTARQRALLFQAAAREVDPAARAGALKRLWALARERGGYLAAVRAGLPLIEPMQPGGRLAFFADEAARAWLAAGRPDRAQAWFAIAERQAGGNSQATAAVQALSPLLALADPERFTWSDDAIARWLDAALARGSEQGARRAVLVFAMLDALDKPVPQRAWTLLRDAAQGRPDAAMPHTGSPGSGIQEAAAAKRRGETIVQILAAAGRAEGGQAPSPAVLHAAIRGLRQVGLEKEARGLAAEAAVAAGV